MIGTKLQYFHDNDLKKPLVNPISGLISNIVEKAFHEIKTIKFFAKNI